MSCSAAEIAEKKRIALEKLKAKKASLVNINNNNSSKQLPQAVGTAPSLCKSVAPGITGNQTPYSISTTNNKNNSKADPPHTAMPVSSLNKPAPTLTKPAGPVSVVPGTENKASSFLNAMKSSNIFKQRQELQHPARDAAHPYKRPASNEVTTGDFYKKKSLDGGNGKNYTQNGGAQTIAAQPQKNVAPVFLNSVSCKVTMINAQRFEVQPSSFHNKLIEVFKSIPSKAYGKHIIEVLKNQSLHISFQILKPVFGILLSPNINCCKIE